MCFCQGFFSTIKKKIAGRFSQTVEPQGLAPSGFLFGKAICLFAYLPFTGLSSYGTNAYRFSAQAPQTCEPFESFALCFRSYQRRLPPQNCDPSALPNMNGGLHHP